MIEWSHVQSGKTEHYVPLIAAQMQYHYARAIKRRLREQNSDLAEYARSTYLPYDRLTKVLRGAAAMSLEGIARAEYLLGEVLSTDVSRSVSESLRRATGAPAGPKSPHGS